MRIVIVILSVIVTAWAQLTVNTPVGVATCQNSLITWSGGSADDSYIVQIASSPSGDTIEAFTGITSTSYSWFVAEPANTQVFIRLLTISRKTAQSAVFTIQAGATQSCTGTSVGSPNPTTSPLPPPESPTSGPAPVPATTIPTPADSSDSSSPTSVLSLTSITIIRGSGSLTFQSNSTSLSRSSSSTRSDLTGASGPGSSGPGSSLDATGSSSGSPNIVLIAGAAGGGAAALVLLLLGICLYRRRKRSTKVTEQSYPIETKTEGPAPDFNPYFPTYSRYSSTTPMVTSYPPANSHESSGAVSQSLHSEPRMTSGSTIPVTKPSYDTAIPATTPSYNTASPVTTPSYNTASPVTTPSYNTAIPVAAPNHNTAIPGPVEDFPPMYRDEDEARMESQRIRAEEAERARQYDALIADFCASNRDLISPTLERKLHAARYLPEDNPSDVPADYWHNTYGVEFFELRRLQTAYERNVATQALINMPEKALPQAALSAKEKAMHPYRQVGRP